MENQRPYTVGEKDRMGFDPSLPVLARSLISTIHQAFKFLKTRLRLNRCVGLSFFLVSINDRIGYWETLSSIERNFNRSNARLQIPFVFEKLFSIDRYFCGAQNFITDKLFGEIFIRQCIVKKDIYKKKCIYLHRA